MFLIDAAIQDHLFIGYAQTIFHFAMFLAYVFMLTPCVRWLSQLQLIFFCALITLLNDAFNKSRNQGMPPEIYIFGYSFFHLENVDRYT